MGLFDTFRTALFISGRNDSFSSQKILAKPFIILYINITAVVHTLKCTSLFQA
jgi:hypothetical protein